MLFGVFYAPVFAQFCIKSTDFFDFLIGNLDRPSLNTCLNEFTVNAKSGKCYISRILKSATFKISALEWDTVITCFIFRIYRNLHLIV